MKNIATLIISIIFLTSFISATIVVNADIKAVYNIGDTIKVPIKITTSTDLSNVKASMKLICNGLETEVYSEYFTIESGFEEAREPSIPLIKELLGRTTGICKIKTSLDEDFELTDEFEISDKITITPKIEKSEYSPGETIIIQGDAIKQNGKPAQGFIEISANIINSSENIKTMDTVKNGYFYVEIPLEENTKAGEYTVNINIYEKNSKDEKTNNGFTSAKFIIIQVPTSLEILFENEEVEPGTSVKTKIILHDQTGEQINSTSIITIKNEKNDILEQVEKPIGEYFEYEIIYNQLPSNWTIVAVSNKLNAERTFNIKERKDIEIELLNETLRITNKGNVFYNDSVLVKIGEESLNLNVTLNIDESREFKLTAPNGEYLVEIIANGKDSLSQNVLLTGKSINVKQASAGFGKIIRHPVVWLFMTAVFGFMIFMFFKKGYQKSIFGYIKSKKKHKNSLEEHTKNFNSLLNFKKTKDKKLIQNFSNKAEIALSIKGTKQDASIVCLQIKNFEEVDESKTKETMENITKLTEENKSVIYENGENIFFLFVPSKTRTFKNERLAVGLAQNIKKILVNHNKLFKQKINFGISVNQGSIIAKPEKDSLKFMSLGAIMNSSKKIASASEEEILLDEKIKSKLATEIKTEKKQGIEAYSIKQIKKLEDNKKFIEGFVKRMKEEKQN